MGEKKGGKGRECDDERIICIIFIICIILLFN